MQGSLTTPYTLSEEQAVRLREASDRALRALEERFAGAVWRDVAGAYMQAQREGGQAEMVALLEALGVEPPVDAETGGRLLALASHLLLGDRIGAATLSRLGEGLHHVQVTGCPIYERLLAEQPLHHADGMTACSCSYRRSGWYDVLGLAAWDEQQSNMKWGDPFCSVVISVA
jgi:hypothetical protein